MVINASQVLAIAHMIQAIAKSHEESFDHDASNKALAQCIIDRTQFTDHNEFYKISINDAVKLHCPEYLIPIISPLMIHHWNSTTNWATRFILSWNVVGVTTPAARMNDAMSAMFRSIS